MLAIPNSDENTVKVWLRWKSIIFIHFLLDMVLSTGGTFGLPNSASFLLESSGIRR